MRNSIPASFFNESLEKHGIMRNQFQEPKFQTLIKEWKKATKRLVLHPPYFTQFKTIVGCRDVMNLLEKTELGAKFISEDDVNACSDPDSDVNKSNILKQVPKKVLAEEKDDKLKLVLQNDKSSPWIFNTGFCPLNA